MKDIILLMKYQHLLKSKFTLKIRKVRRKITEIHSENDIKYAEEYNMMALFICGNKENSKEKFDIIEKNTLYYDTINVTWSNSLEVKKYLNCTIEFDIILMKNIDDKYTRFEGEFNEEKYVEWISSATTPIVMDLTPEKMQVIFQENIPTLIFLSKGSKDNNEKYKMFYDTAKYFKVNLL